MRAPAQGFSSAMYNLVMMDSIPGLQKNMSVRPLLMIRLSEKANCDVTTPSGASILRNDIEARTGHALSLNTIKRITGVLKSDITPRTTTLDILAVYLGYPDWKVFIDNLYPKSSAFYKTKPYIDAREESIGSRIEIGWGFGRPHRVRIRHLGEGRYEVESSRESKLQPGDILHLTFIARQYPLIVSDVERGGEHLGCYIAGIDTGIILIRSIGQATV